MLCQAFRMVAQNLNNLAFRHAVALAFGDHAFQFLLESLQTLYAPFNLRQLSPRNDVGVGAGSGWIVGEIQ